MYIILKINNLSKKNNKNIIDYIIKYVPYKIKKIFTNKEYIGIFWQKKDLIIKGPEVNEIEKFKFYIKSNYDKYCYNFTIDNNHLISSEKLFNKYNFIRFYTGTKIIKGPKVNKNDIIENTNMEIFIKNMLNNFKVIRDFDFTMFHGYKNFYIKDNYIYFQTYQQYNFINLLKNCPFIYNITNIYLSYKIENIKNNYINNILPIYKNFSINSFERLIKNENFITYYFKKILNMIRN